MNPRVFGAPPIAALLVLLVCSAPLAAQGGLPPAQELVERHLAAMGGREALTAKQSISTRGTFELPAMRMRGEMLATHSARGTMITRILLSGVGELVTGYDGEHAWTSNSVIGARLLRGAEAAQLRDDGSLFALLREQPAVRELETVGTMEIDGERCYRVRVTWSSGRRSHDCYSVASGLLIAKEMTQLSPTGALDVTVLLSEYRQFGDLRIPTVTVQRAAGQEQVLRVEQVEYDAAGDAAFTPPADVAALIERQRAGGSR